MSVDESGQFLVQRAADLRPVLEQHRGIGDQQRRMPEATVQALTDAGLFRALVSRRFGGLECDLRTIIDATAQVARADPSAGWSLMIAESSAFLTGLFPAAAQEEVYADGPDTVICSVFSASAPARRVDDGWLLKGRWAPASGCLHARWALLGFHPEDAEAAWLALVPMEELRVEDTWFTLGMRATGSNLLVADDVVVPDHRVLHFDEVVVGRGFEQRPPHHRKAPMAALTAYMIAPYWGIASAAWDFVVEQSGKRGISFTSYGVQREATAFQLAVADAATKIEVARMIAHDSAEIVERHAASGSFPDRLTRARVRMHTGHAVQQCREAVDVLASAHGSASVAESNPLHLYLRDMHTASRHGVANLMSCAEIFGREVLGIEPNISELF